MSDSDDHKRKSIFRQIIVSVIVALLVGSTAPWWWNEIFSSENESKTSGNQEQFDREPQVSDQPSGTDEGEERTTITEENSASGCVVTISNKLVSLMSDPDPFSTEITSVDPGEYETIDYTVVETGPGEQGWFKINVNGREGWIKNDTWTIESKTADCP